MSSFSQHNSSLETDSVFSPNSPLKNYGVLDELFPNWNQLFTSFEQIPLLLPHLESSSIDDVSNHGRSFESSSVAEKQGTQSFSSMAESWEQVSQVCSSLHKKRKSRNGPSSNSANFEDVKNTKSKKQKGDKEAKKEDKKCEKEKEPPKGYIHVRARRGQATDSHSLAERVRRGKLSEKMKMLQGLVPGCDKVTGKALMLDEIINYVQSLQTQVEFLSLRLASLDPMVYNFGLPFMPFENQEFTNNNNTPPQTGATITSTSNNSVTESVNFINSNTTNSSITNGETVQLSSFTSNAIATTNTTTATIDPTTFPSLHIIDSSTNLLQPGQKTSVLPIQDDRILYWGSGIEDQNRLSFLNQFGFAPTSW